MKLLIIAIIALPLFPTGLRAQQTAEPPTSAVPAPAPENVAPAEQFVVEEDGMFDSPDKEIWTLDRCIAYALEHNIDVRQRALQVEQNRIDLNTARMSRLPELGASIGADASFGRTIGSDNTYHSTNQTSGSLNVSASMPLFQGLRINRQIERGKLDLEAALQDLERAREDISVNVMTLYLQALFTRELLGVAERQLKLSAQQVKRSRELVDAGKKPESARYESEALAANDLMTLTQARNDLRLALLDLSQALNRPSVENFDIAQPELDSVSLASLRELGSPVEVYAYAAEHRPHIRSERLRVQSSEQAVDIARSALYPSISLSGGYGTGVYSADSEKFWAQMNNNSREYVGLSVNIPIFNRRATRNNIRSARVSLRSQQLVLAQAELALRKEIEQAWVNAKAAYSKYTSAEIALRSARIAFAYEQERADAGRSTVFDFNDAKTRLEKAESDLLQAKYEFVFRRKILAYYRGEPLGL